MLPTYSFISDDKTLPTWFWRKNWFIGWPLACCSIANCCNCCKLCGLGKACRPLSSCSGFPNIPPKLPRAARVDPTPEFELLGVGIRGSGWPVTWNIRDSYNFKTIKSWCGRNLSSTWYLKAQAHIQNVNEFRDASLTDLHAPYFLIFMSGQLIDVK